MKVALYSDAVRLFRPRIFISYAREDAALAASLRDVLIARGFAAFVDSSEMIGGEDFVRRIDEELRRSDAVIALFTPASAQSEWCNAEWYFAHARGLTVIPIRFGDVEDVLPNPVKLLEERIHYLSPRDLIEFHRVGEEIATQLAGVRRRRAARVLTIGAGCAALVALLAWGLQAVDARVERMVRSRERNALVQRITGAQQPLAGEELRQAAAKFDGDDALLATTLRLASDSYASDATRLNALMLSTDLLRRRRPEVRWVVKDAKWRNGVIDGGRIADVTFSSGVVEQLDVRNATLASVYWNGTAMTLARSTFQNVKFNSGGFAGTNAVGVKFTDCVFRGAEVDVTNFASVEFRSTPSDGLIITGNVGAFENSVILNRAPPPDPRVLEIRNPAAEVRFVDVVFTGVRFRGFLRPDWFKNCSFDRCTLPSSLPIEALVREGNNVSASYVADESLD